MDLGTLSNHSLTLCLGSSLRSFPNRNIMKYQHLWKVQEEQSTRMRNSKWGLSSIKYREWWSQLGTNLGANYPDHYQPLPIMGFLYYQSWDFTKQVSSTQMLKIFFFYSIHSVHAFRIISLIHEGVNKKRSCSSNMGATGPIFFFGPEICWTMLKNANLRNLGVSSCFLFLLGEFFYTQNHPWKLT